VRKRNYRCEVKFTKEELSELHKKARKAGLSVGGFIRRVVKDTAVRESPPADYYELIREVRKVGTNINQIAKTANTKGIIDVPELRRALESNRAVEAMLWQTFMPEE